MYRDVYIQCIYIICKFYMHVCIYMYTIYFMYEYMIHNMCLSKKTCCQTAITRTMCGTVDNMLQLPPGPSQISSQGALLE